MGKVAIVAARRSAIGTFNGALATLSASDIGAQVISQVLVDAKITDTKKIDDVIMGQVLTGAVGMNPARQSVIGASIDISVPAMTINHVCGSGLRSVLLGAQAIVAGDAHVVIAGGQESMSSSTHAMHLRAGVRMGHGKLIDTMINDGLTDVFNKYHMGVTAENVAKQFNVDRQAQDEFAANSQQKAQVALEQGRFKEEIVEISIPQRKGESLTFSIDEYPKKHITAEGLAKLRPAFDKEGTVTAGNASGINDGAACVVLMSEQAVAEHGAEVLAYFEAGACTAIDPAIMGMGPVSASGKVLEKSGWKIDDLDLMEVNEAFAAQAIAVNQQMAWNTDKINVNGGAIALGHPIGASGNRILVTLIHEMIKRDVKRGLASLCIGGGMGIAATISRG